MLPEADPIALIQRGWRVLGGSGAGRLLFAQALGRLVPYSGSVPFGIEDLSPGQATLTLPDRRAIRNHLGSIHAVALANVLELAANLALVPQMARGQSFIVTRLDMRYLAKARGTLRIEGSAPTDLSALTESTPLTLETYASASNAAGVRVCEATAEVRVRMKGRAS